jgi:hypothetical protein
MGERSDRRTVDLETLVVVRGGGLGVSRELTPNQTVQLRNLLWAGAISEATRVSVHNCTWLSARTIGTLVKLGLAESKRRRKTHGSIIQTWTSYWLTHAGVAAARALMPATPNMEGTTQ